MRVWLELSGTKGLSGWAGGRRAEESGLSESSWGTLRPILNLMHSDKLHDSPVPLQEDIHCACVCVCQNHHTLAPALTRAQRCLASLAKRFQTVESFSNRLIDHDCMSVAAAECGPVSQRTPRSDGTEHPRWQRFMVTGHHVSYWLQRSVYVDGLFTILVMLSQINWGTHPHTHTVSMLWSW